MERALCGRAPPKAKALRVAAAQAAAVSADDETTISNLLQQLQEAPLAGLRVSPIAFEKVRLRPSSPRIRPPSHPIPVSLSPPLPIASFHP